MHFVKEEAEKEMEMVVKRNKTNEEIVYLLITTSQKNSDDSTPTGKNKNWQDCNRKSVKA